MPLRSAGNKKSHGFYAVAFRFIMLVQYQLTTLPFSHGLISRAAKVSVSVNISLFVNIVNTKRILISVSSNVSAV